MVVQSIYLNKDNVSKESWQELINYVCKYNGYFRNFKIVVEIFNNKLKYYLVTKYRVPPTINSMDDFLIKENNVNIVIDYEKAKPVVLDVDKNAVELFDISKLKHDRELKYIIINIRGLGNKRLFKTYMFFKNNNAYIRRRFLMARPTYILSVDFSNNKRFSYEKKNKYLNLEKILPLLTNDNKGMFCVDSFPYLRGELFLNYKDYDFFKHSLIIGSSGSGKSKLISLLVKNIMLNNNDDYKVVIIDPHASLQNDLGGLNKTRVIDFLNDKVDLFTSGNTDIVIKSELMISVFKNLMKDGYNLKLERVLRYTIYLLLTKQDFSFSNIRKVLLDLEYRNNLVKELTPYLNDTVISFFLTEFNDLKTNYYNESISPLISFIDEMLVFSTFDKFDENVIDVVSENDLIIFSLDRSILGDRIVKTISSLVMEEILEAAIENKINKKLLLVVDEVALLENPIMERLLSEARKFGISLVLAEQYFGQISKKLQESIFANVINYYAFRISRDDALLLKDVLDVKFAKTATEDDKINLFTGLNNREVVVRVSKDGKILPVFKAKTTDFEAVPLVRDKVKVFTKIKDVSNNVKLSLSNYTNKKLKDILVTLSNSRKRHGDKV